MDDRSTTSTSDDPIEYVTKTVEKPHAVVSRELTRSVRTLANQLRNIQASAERALKWLSEHPEVTLEMIEKGDIPHMGWIIGALNDINHNVFHAGRAAESAHAVCRTATEAGVLLTEHGPITLKVNDG